MLFTKMFSRSRCFMALSTSKLSNSVCIYILFFTITIKYAPMNKVIELEIPGNLTISSRCYLTTTFSLTFYSKKALVPFWVSFKLGENPPQKIRQFTTCYYSKWWIFQVNLIFSRYIPSGWWYFYSVVPIYLQRWEHQTMLGQNPTAPWLYNLSPSQKKPVFRGKYIKCIYKPTDKVVLLWHFNLLQKIYVERYWGISRIPQSLSMMVDGLFCKKNIYKHWNFKHQ